MSEPNDQFKPQLPSPSGVFVNIKRPEDVQIGNAESAADEPAIPQLPPPSLITIQGIGVRYVGRCPTDEVEPKLPSGASALDFEFLSTPLQFVPFDRNLMVKDFETGEYYFPSENCRSWEDCELNGNKLFAE